ncbi:MAG: hypothetical protein HY068_09150 [Burkholderiales bacterium]|nr:hypothetical protein [Burkholderiales bacterium]
MAADFFFQNPTLEIQLLKPVAVFKWSHLNNSDVQYAIAAEEQYLQFHLYMLENLRHTEVGKVAAPPYSYELGLSVRAGAVKAAVLIAASIVEAALRALAEQRGYPLNKDPRRRTFGNVIAAWEDAGTPRTDVAAIWSQVKSLHEVRNFVHLHKAAGSAEAAWENVLKDERALLDGALNAIKHVSGIKA